MIGLERLVTLGRLVGLIILGSARGAALVARPRGPAVTKLLIAVGRIAAPLRTPGVLLILSLEALVTLVLAHTSVLLGSHRLHRLIAL
jgi:hypothetical protein